MKFSKILTLVLAICLMATLAFTLSSCSDEDAITEMVSVKIKNDKQNIELKATLDSVYVENHSGETLYIVELYTASTEKIPADASVVGEVSVKSSITHTIPLADEKGLSRLQRAYVLAEKTMEGYAALTSAMYIQNPDALSNKTSAAPSVSTIKGFEIDDVFEAELVGADHVLFEIDFFDAYAFVGLFGEIRYDRDGISYFFSEPVIAALDEKVKTANELGMRVYLKTTYDPSLLDAALDGSLDAWLGNNQKLPDVKDPEVARRLDAFYAFLADRYSGDAGQVSDYIIGKKANDKNGASMDDAEYEELYFAWLRTAHTALTSVDSNAKVYASVSNEWRSAGSSVIGAKAFLTHLAETTKTGGDYDWGIALDLGTGRDLPALLEDGSYDYSNIGIDNMGEISELRELASMRFGSEKRDFIIDALALDADTTTEQNRAAYYICAYYKASEIGAGAFIYSVPEKTDLYDKNGKPGALYYMTVLCGSDKTEQLASYTAKVDGFTADRFDAYAKKNVIYLQSAAYELDSATAKKVTEFPALLGDFECNGLTRAYMALEARPDGSYRRVLNVTASTKDGIGSVTAFNVDAKAIKAARYIAVTASSKNNPTLFISVSNKSGDVVYIAQTKLVNAETEYYFDIEKLAPIIAESDDLTVSLCIVSDDADSEVTVTDLSLYGASGLDSTTVIIIIVVAVVVVGLVGLIVLLAVRRKKKQQRKAEDD